MFWINRLFVQMGDYNRFYLRAALFLFEMNVLGHAWNLPMWKTLDELVPVPVPVPEHSLHVVSPDSLRFKSERL